MRMRLRNAHAIARLTTTNWDQGAKSALAHNLAQAGGGFPIGVPTSLSERGLALLLLVALRLSDSSRPSSSLTVEARAQVGSASRLFRCRWCDARDQRSVRAGRETNQNRAGQRPLENGRAPGRHPALSSETPRCRASPSQDSGLRRWSCFAAHAGPRLLRTLAMVWQAPNATKSANRPAVPP